MNASDFLRHLVVGALFAASATVAVAEQGLGSTSQTKVNSAKARMWQGSEDKNPMQGTKDVVNIGSKRAGTCNLNVGTAESGKKAPKEIVVTAKSIINVCK